MGKYVKGGARFRRLLAGIEPGMRQELTDAMRAGGEELLSDMRAIAPVYEGNDARRTPGYFASRLKVVFLRAKTLTMKVGLSKADSANLSPLFYARILEFGAKPKQASRQVTRHHGSKVTTYTLHNAKRAPRHTIYARGLDARRVMNRVLKGIWVAALGRAARGAGSSDDDS
jgi:hypothetical protein